MAAAYTGPAVQLEVKDGIALLRMIRGENKWNKTFLDDFTKALDIVESNPKIRFLVITGQGKFFSYGLDLPWIAKQTVEVNMETTRGNYAIIDRIVTFPVPTIAAINGHAFGMGAILAVACDYRVMRKGRGWLCFPETKLKMKLTGATLEVIRLKLGNLQTIRDAVIFSKRYTAEEALKADIADEAVDIDELLPMAFRYGREIAGGGLDRGIVKAVKDKLFGAPIRETRNKEFQNMTEEDKLERARAFMRGAQLLSSKI